MLLSVLICFYGKKISVSEFLLSARSSFLLFPIKKENRQRLYNLLLIFILKLITICLFSSNFLLILKCYNNVFPVCHIFKHTLDYFLCILVGYIADFICYVANDVVQIQMNLPLRIIALLLAQLMASMGVALYMVANMGIAPYDSVAIIIEKLTHQKIPFHKARVLSDVVVVIIGIIFAIASGAGIWSVVGIGTIINACFNGPLIQFFKTKLERFYL